LIHPSLLIPPPVPKFIKSEILVPNWKKWEALPVTYSSAPLEEVEQELDLLEEPEVTEVQVQEEDKKRGRKKKKTRTAKKSGSLFPREFLSDDVFIRR
jgi:hypothetical protein